MDASRFRAILLLTLIFAAGAAVGVAGDRLDLFPGVAEATEPAESGPAADDPRGERDGRQTTIEEFADELGLDHEQRSQIEGYLDHYREGAKALQQAVRPQYRALMDSVRTQIESVLTDEQVDDYRGLLRQRYRNGRERSRDDRDPKD